MGADLKSLRALLERAELPECEAKQCRAEGVPWPAWYVMPVPASRSGAGERIAEIMWDGPGLWGDAATRDRTAARAELFAALPEALPGLLDAAERAEREHREAGESTRAAWRESERREQEMRNRLIAAERERDDLAATLETRNAEHAAALRALSEARAVVDASMTFSDGVDPWCRRCGTDWADAEHPKRCIVGRLVAILGTTAEVPR